jgi:formylglycine-generating enzyme
LNHTPFSVPEWAEAAGIDQWGYWADLRIGAAIQRMRYIQPGSFWRGSPCYEEGRSKGSSCIQEDLLETRVCVDFWLADTACTHHFWGQVTHQYPLKMEQRPNAPVVGVTENVAKNFMESLQKFLPKNWRASIPTTSLWEYACRAGGATAYSWGSEPQPSSGQPAMNFSESRRSFNSAKNNSAVQPEKTLEVKDSRLQPNAWGLWQMHGNVFELCAGSYKGTPESQIVSLTAALFDARVQKGGSYFSTAEHTRAAYTGVVDSDESLSNQEQGFRLMLFSI